MNMDFFKKQIQKMDVKSDEFFEIYKLVADKYYKLKDPDEYQQAVMLLRMFADKSDEEDAIVASKIINELFKMEIEGTPAIMGTFGFKDKEYHFTFSIDDKHTEKLKEMMGKVLSGDFKLTNEPVDEGK